MKAKMTTKDRLITGGLLGVFALSMFLPVMRFSFIEEMSGYQAFGANALRLIFVENYLEYLSVMFTVVSPIFLLILIFWTMRPQLKLIPVALLSSVTLFGGVVWLFKYGSQSILLYGYWVWLLLIVATVGVSFWKLKTQK